MIVLMVFSSFVSLATFRVFKGLEIRLIHAYD